MRDQLRLHRGSSRGVSGLPFGVVHQTTNDDEAEMDNCGAVGCEVVEAEKK
jgi:hypothetical protein